MFISAKIIKNIWYWQKMNEKIESKKKKKKKEIKCFKKMVKVV